MDNIAPGTPCFLINLIEMQELVGRVVEVLAGPMPDEDGWSYKIDAAWLREKFPGAPVLAPRHHLRPIVPPELEPTAMKLRAA